jgi:hypothetical protein
MVVNHFIADTRTSKCGLMANAGSSLMGIGTATGNFKLLLRRVYRIKNKLPNICGFFFLYFCIFVVFVVVVYQYLWG